MAAVGSVVVGVVVLKLGAEDPRWSSSTGLRESH